MAAGIPHPGGRCARPEDEPCRGRDRDRHTPALIGTRFGLSLPAPQSRGVLENERLPAFVTA
ncbi:hypothetical protein ACFY04_28325 [Streptomyces sp. NPDC001549]|uniref:hypothetical protein n=1 Tax=Streptomyces sp. NPDC001549 TaxID=3364586 RepID=UPI0036B8D2CD